MPLKFAANLSFMFQELPSLEARYGAAKNAGFKYVEFAFPYSESVGDLQKAREDAGVEQVLINAFPGWLFFLLKTSSHHPFSYLCNLQQAYTKAGDILLHDDRVVNCLG